MATSGDQGSQALAFVAIMCLFGLLVSVFSGTHIQWLPIGLAVVQILRMSGGGGRS